MNMKSIIKAGLLTATLAGLAAPTLAQPGGGEQRAEQDRRGGGAWRGNDNGGRRDNGGRGNEARERPAPNVATPAPAPAAPPVVRAAPPTRNVEANRSQRSEAPRPGTPQWYGERGITPPQPAADRNNNAAPDRGRPSGGWQNGGANNQPRDRDGRGNGGRDGNWRGNDGRDGRDRDVRGNDGRDRNWNNNNNWNDNRRNWNNNRPPVTNRWQGQRRWDNDGWRNDRRYDWQDWRRQNRQIYRLPSYRAPYGWHYGYSRFSIGVYVDSLLFGSTYWIDDPYRYRLPPVYGTLRWVRYYDDALLIDIRDGYVVDVIYDVFW